MAAPSYATDLVDIFTDGTTSGWSALGGGASGLNQETDYFIQGTSCLSKNAWAGATKGMIYDNGSGVTVPTDGAVMVWITHLTPNSLDVKSNGGIQVLVGSSTSAYKQWYVGGSDTITFGGWITAAVNPSTTNQSSTGSPSTTLQTFGGLAALPSGGPTKGAPFGIDAIRYGRVTLTCTNGDGTNGYATFSGAATYATNVTRRWGQLNTRDGAYYLQGFLSLGSSGTAVDFRDSNKVVFIRDTDRATSAFNRIEELNSGSNVAWTNISIQALGTTSPGTFVITAGAFSADTCTFTDMGTFTFISSSSATGTTFRRCGQITAAGATITSCFISNSTATSALLWDVATDTNGKLDSTEFTSSGTGHGIELGSNTPSTITLSGVKFNNYATSDGTTGNECIYNNSGKSITINISGGDTPTIRNGTGASTSVASSVTVTIHVQDSSQTAVQNADVYVTRDSDSSVIINSSSTDASGNASGSTVSGAGGITIRVRKSSPGDTRYFPASSTATVGGTNLTINVTLTEDTIAQ